MLVVTETSLAEDQGIEMGANMVSLCNESAYEGGRAAGGTAVLISHLLEFEMMRKVVFDNTALIALRINVALLGRIYSPPRAPWSGMRRALDAFQRLEIGKALLAGDFNARREGWCTASNLKANNLRAWAQRKRWAVRAPPQTTYCNSNDMRTTIDLALVNSGTLRRMNARVEWLDNFRGSDNAPVLMEW